MNKTKRLTESAMLIALAVVLEVVGRMVIPPMPFGGQLTLCAMLPIVLISYRHGVKWGLTAGFGYALVQMAMGAGTVTAAFQPGYFGDGTMIGRALTMCLLDYVLAYTLLGLGGCFRNRLPRGAALSCGSLVALAPDILSIFSPAISFSPAGRNGSSPRRASLPGVRNWFPHCLPVRLAGCTPSSTTVCT